MSGYRRLADQMDDFEPEPLGQSTERAAIKVVCGNATTAQDARELMDMLGLSPENASMSTGILA